MVCCPDLSRVWANVCQKAEDGENGAGTVQGTEMSARFRECGGVLFGLVEGV